MRNNRFVLDNNIWISYFITNQQQHVIEIIDSYDIAIFSCDELVEEFTTVLNTNTSKNLILVYPKQ